LFSSKFLYYSDMITQKLVQKFVEVERNPGHKKVQGELVMEAYVHPCGEEEALLMVLDLLKLTSICYHFTPGFTA
jgi:hypothetical protein